MRRPRVRSADNKKELAVPTYEAFGSAGLSALCGRTGPPLSPQADDKLLVMPKNSTILIVRHGEKPANGADLTPGGLARAAAYVRFFENYPPGSTTPLTINYVFSAANSSASCRPQLTIAPFAAAHALPINDTYADTDFAKLAGYIKGGGYDNSTLLICWHHEEALDLANALGVDPTKLPSSANWPTSWPGGPPPTPDVYGWVLQIVYDSNGNVDTSQTVCTSEQLMYDDYGQDPPDGTPSAS